MRPAIWLSACVVAGCLGCVAQEAVLPAPRSYDEPEACSAPAPPPLMALEQPTDPQACLTHTHGIRGVTVLLNVSAEGRIEGLEPHFELCAAMGADGIPLPPVELSIGEAQCVLERLRSWRFAAFDTCAPQQAFVVLRDAPLVGGRRRASLPCGADAAERRSNTEYPTKTAVASVLGGLRR